MAMRRLLLLTTLLTAGALVSCAGGTEELGPVPTSDPGSGEGGVRGPVYLEEAELQVMESYPIQLAVRLKGNLPTPCHTLHWQVSGPEAGEFEIEVYSTILLGQDCIQVLEPFEETIPLGTVEGGSYTVSVNGQQVGAVDA